MASEYILDIQGFKSVNNEYIVKELAIISTDESIYELQLFKPPCDFKELPDYLQKQVVWLENQYHGLFWGSGTRNYSELKDVFKGLNLNGIIYVKGLEKKEFVMKLLSPELMVNIVNIEDMNCPNLNILKQMCNPKVLKPCAFNHNNKHCAYVNAHVILHWLRLEKFVDSRNMFANKAIEEFYKCKSVEQMPKELIKYLPKVFILHNVKEIDPIFDHLSFSLKNDSEILENLICKIHSFSDTQGKVYNLKRKHCFLCEHDV